MAQPVQHLDLDPRAADFLELLRDLGHVDAAGVERITGDLLSKDRTERRVSYDEVRRAAATLLFDQESSMRPESRELLMAEWARLFF